MQYKTRSLSLSNQISSPSSSTCLYNVKSDLITLILCMLVQFCLISRHALFILLSPEIKLCVSTFCLSAILHLLLDWLCWQGQGLKIHLSSYLLQFFFPIYCFECRSILWFCRLPHQSLSFPIIKLKLALSPSALSGLLCHI